MLSKLQVSVWLTWHKCQGSILPLTPLPYPFSLPLPLVTPIPFSQANLRMEAIAREILLKNCSETLGLVANIHVQIRAYPYVMDFPQVGVGDVGG